jgi:hypothetical protein
MSDVHLVGTVDEEGFAAPAPCKTEALLGYVACGVVVEGVDKERDPEGIVVLDGAIDVERGMKEVFVFVGW